jgi:glycosyltransferase involved in cell wall biosynthesis
MGSSGPLFHAMSYGKCVIATREGYFKEDIIHLKTGILTDNTKWKNAFEFAVNHPKLIANIEKNVTKKARDQEPATVARRYVQVYNSL